VTGVGVRSLLVSGSAREEEEPVLDVVEGDDLLEEAEPAVGRPIGSGFFAGSRSSLRTAS